MKMGKEAKRSVSVAICVHQWLQSLLVAASIITRDFRREAGGGKRVRLSAGSVRLGAGRVRFSALRSGLSALFSMSWI